MRTSSLSWLFWALKARACWHSGHSHLFSFLTRKEYLYRIKFIKTNKPENERELRLRLLKPVKGKLPAAFVKANAAWVKADAAWDTAYAAWDTAYAAFVKALADNLPAIEVLHAKECKDCPWDGKTIFPEAEVES